VEHIVEQVIQETEENDVIKEVTSGDTVEVRRREAPFLRGGSWCGCS
jgi:hypothetical protein